MTSKYMYHRDLESLREGRCARVQKYTEDIGVDLLDNIPHFLIHQTSSILSALRVLEPPKPARSARRGEIKSRF
jgi:hypothetical protein